MRGAPYDISVKAYALDVLRRIWQSDGLATLVFRLNAMTWLLFVLQMVAHFRLSCLLLALLCATIYYAALIYLDLNNRSVWFYSIALAGAIIGVWRVLLWYVS